jgi:hypothetical protein
MLIDSDCCNFNFTFRRTVHIRDLVVCKANKFVTNADSSPN